MRGVAEGWRNLLKFEIFCSLNSISHYVRGIQYTPNEDRPITIQLWLGTPAKFRFRFVRTEAGLILWEICVETSASIVVEAVWKSMLTRLMIALLFLAPEIVPVLVLAQTNLDSEAGTYTSGLSFGQIVYFLHSSSGLVLIPESRQRNTKQRAFLHDSL